MSHLLLIGGTVFLGRAVVEEALRRGHSVTTVNRGRSGSDVEGVEALRADRSSVDELSAAVDGRRWDAVVDTCGFVPRTVSAGARLLSTHVGHYVYVSAVDVCRDWPEKPVGDGSATLPGSADADESAGPYPVLKAGCELAVRRDFAGPSLIVRPGIIVGPGENIGRLPWWLRRARRGGAVLAAGEPDRGIQLIDCRDLAAFIVSRVEAVAAGSYLATAPVGAATFGSLLELCAVATGTRPDITWTADDYLLSHGVKAWWELPLWAPRSGGWPHAWSVSTEPAVAAGLRCRPLAETVEDTWRWLRDRPDFTGRPKIGIDPGKERRLLEGWSQWASTCSTSS